MKSSRYGVRKGRDSMAGSLSLTQDHHTSLCGPVCRPLSPSCTKGISNLQPGAKPTTEVEHPLMTGPNSWSIDVSTAGLTIPHGSLERADHHPQEHTDSPCVASMERWVSLPCEKCSKSHHCTALKLPDIHMMARRQASSTALFWLC